MIASTSPLKIARSSSVRGISCAAAQRCGATTYGLPGSKTFASTGEDQTIRIWDVETKRETHAFRGSAGAILTLRFADVPGMIVAGAKDGTARMWNLTDLARR